MNNKKAFTLIELLVVITIIALLVSIVMPALNKARDNAKRVVCASNIKSIGQGLMVYTSSNRDKLPEALYNNTGSGGTHMSYMMMMIDRNSSLKPIDRIQDYYGMGKLIEKKIIPTPEVFYCPAAPTKRAGGSGGADSLAFTFKDYSDPYGFPWSPEDMINNMYVRSSYNYVPQSSKNFAWVNISAVGTAYSATDAINDGGVVNGNKERFPQIAKTTTELTGRYAMLTEIIHGLDFLMHKTGKSSAGLNVMMGDCSVKFSNSQEAITSTLWDSNDLGSQEYPFRKLLSMYERN